MWINTNTYDVYLTHSDFRLAFCKTSFPKNLTDEIMAAFNVYPVVRLDQPEFDDRTQRVEQDTQPSLVDGVWTVGWAVKDKTAEEVQEHDDNEAAGVRSERNMLLSGSDWTQVADAPVDAAAWAAYRQALRDITDHVNFPYLQEGDWPVKPA